MLKMQYVDKATLDKLVVAAKAANSVVAATSKADGDTDDGSFAAIHEMANDLTISTQTALAKALGWIKGNGDPEEDVDDLAQILWAGNASDEEIDRAASFSPSGRKLLGYQFASEMGENIHGSERDPSGGPSFRILSLEEANGYMADPDNGHLHLQPIYEGDIQNPELPG
jgi:hypothetical protein